MPIRHVTTRLGLPDYTTAVTRISLAPRLRAEINALLMTNIAVTVPIGGILGAIWQFFANADLIYPLKSAPFRPLYAAYDAARVLRACSIGMLQKMFRLVQVEYRADAALDPKLLLSFASVTDAIRDKVRGMKLTDALKSPPSETDLNAFSSLDVRSRAATWLGLQIIDSVPRYAFWAHEYVQMPLSQTFIGKQLAASLPSDDSKLPAAYARLALLSVILRLNLMSTQTEPAKIGEAQTGNDIRIAQSYLDAIRDSLVEAAGLDVPIAAALLLAPLETGLIRPTLGNTDLAVFEKALTTVRAAASDDMGSLSRAIDTLAKGVSTTYIAREGVKMHVLPYTTPETLDAGIAINEGSNPTRRDFKTVHIYPFEDRAPLKPMSQIAAVVTAAKWLEGAKPGQQDFADLNVLSVMGKTERDVLRAGTTGQRQDPGGWWRGLGDRILSSVRVGDSALEPAFLENGTASISLTPPSMILSQPLIPWHVLNGRASAELFEKDAATFDDAAAAIRKAVTQAGQSDRTDIIATVPVARQVYRRTEREVIPEQLWRLFPGDLIPGRPISGFDAAALRSSISASTAEWAAFAAFRSRLNDVAGMVGFRRWKPAAGPLSAGETFDPAAAMDNNLLKLLADALTYVGRLVISASFVPTTKDANTIAVPIFAADTHMNVPAQAVTEVVKAASAKAAGSIISGVRYDANPGGYVPAETFRLYTNAPTVLAIIPGVALVLYDYLPVPHRLDTNVELVTADPSDPILPQPFAAAGLVLEPAPVVNGSVGTIRRMMPFVLGNATVDDLSFCRAPLLFEAGGVGRADSAITAGMRIFIDPRSLTFSDAEVTVGDGPNAGLLFWDGGEPSLSEVSISALSFVEAATGFERMIAAPNIDNAFLF